VKDSKQVIITIERLVFVAVDEAGRPAAFNPVADDKM
jgi:hypothetical protein